MSQPQLFEDRADKVERITAAIAEKFGAYGEGTDVNHKNPVAATLRNQPAQFPFGVSVRDVVNAVLDLAEQQS